MEKFKNKDVEKDLPKLILLDKIGKGNISGNSIEVEEGNGFKSYVYYDKVTDRDDDYQKLMRLRLPSEPTVCTQKCTPMSM